MSESIGVGSLSTIKMFQALYVCLVDIVLSDFIL